MVTAPSGVVHSGLLEKLGTNAYKKAGDHITWEGAINALQTQLATPIHVGAKTALHLLGLGHFVSMQGMQHIMLFAPATTKIPKWLLANTWNAEFDIYKSSLFSNVQGLVERPSVDIDLTYLPIESRDVFLTNIEVELLKMKQLIEQLGVTVKTVPIKNGSISKLQVYSNNGMIKIEPDFVLRGSVFPCDEKGLCDKAQDQFLKFMRVKTLSVAQYC